jgi:4-amino-4-deoxy-L-arabinose transferase-like glycosyltransferase
MIGSSRRMPLTEVGTFAVVPVAVVATLVVVGLLILSPAYGFHRDELYFIVAGRHPAFGYVDQPPLTPLLSAGAAAILGPSPTAIRILPALVAGAIVILAAAMARDLGGTPRAQVLAAVTMGTAGLLAAGHHASTTTYDLLAWAIILWLVIRLLAGADPRWWLAVGVAAGLGLQNKHIPLFLGAGLAIGLLLSRRWDVIRSPWAWGAIGLAVVIWLPNLAWQAANGFPQLEMAGAIAGDAGENRVELLPQLLLICGIFLFPVSLAGGWWLLRAREASAWRPIIWATLATLLLIVASGGKSYYLAGFVAPLVAAGSIVTDGWIARGRGWLRVAVFAAAATATLVVSSLLVLPIVPAASLASTPIPDIYEDTAEEVGWPELVATVEGVVDGLTIDEQAAAVIVTSNYGEAGALELLGTDLPPVHSGHNSYWDWGPPADDRTVAIVLSWSDPSTWDVGLGACRLAARIDNGVAIENEEQGAGVWVCPAVVVPWSVSWDGYRHLS